MTDDRQPLRRPWTRKTIRLGLGAVTLAGMTLLVADNFVLIDVGLVLARVEMRLGWALALAMTVGMVIGVALAWATNLHS